MIRTVRSSGIFLIGIFAALVALIVAQTVTVSGDEGIRVVGYEVSPTTDGTDPTAELDGTTAGSGTIVEADFTLVTDDGSLTVNVDAGSADTGTTVEVQSFNGENTLSELAQVTSTSTGTSSTDASSPDAPTRQIIAAYEISFNASPSAGSNEQPGTGDVGVQLSEPVELTFDLGAIGVAGLRAAALATAQAPSIARWNGSRWFDLPTIVDRESNTATAFIEAGGLYAAFLRDLETHVVGSGLTVIPFAGANGTGMALAFADSGGIASFFSFDATSGQYRSFNPGAPGTLSAVSEFDPVFVSAPAAGSWTQFAPIYRARTVAVLPGLDFVTYTGANVSVDALTIDGAWTAGWLWDNESDRWLGFFPQWVPSIVNSVQTLQTGDIVAIVSPSGATWAMP